MLTHPPPRQIATADLERLRTFIKNQFGLHFPPERTGDLARRVDEAIHQTGCRDAEGFYRALISPGSKAVMDRLAAVLTVGETSFNRNHAQFAALRGTVLPELIDRRRRQGRLHLRIWSCGCSTGEEPYSLAIALTELLPDLSRWAITLLGTDLNRDALKRAEAATYGAWSFREMEPALRDRHFRYDGRTWVLREPLRRMVTFRHHNLAGEAYPPGITPDDPVDLILCRNVTIYFDPITTQQAINRLHRILTPEGWLLVGAAEPNLHHYRQFTMHNIGGAIFYRKPAGAPATDAARDSVPARPAGLAEPAPAQPPPPFPETPPDSGTTGEMGDPRECLLRARESANQGTLDQAREWAAAGIRLCPLNPEVYFMLALISREQGQSEAAIHEIRRALFLDRSFLPGHYLLGLLLHGAGKPAQAVKAWRIALDLLRDLPDDVTFPSLDGASAGQLRASVKQHLQGGDP